MPHYPRIIPCPTCGRPYERGLLRSHCAAFSHPDPRGENRRRLSKEWEPRFVSRIVMGDGCWEWSGARDRAGYGQIKIEGRQSKAHRVAWERAFGPIPAGLSPLHKCDNPPCVRPDHLFLGTIADNNADRAAKGRNRNQWAKIPKDHHALIRQRVSNGETKSSIAREYSVNPSRIWAIAQERR